MKIFAKVLGTLMLWGTMLVLGSEMVRGARRLLSRRHSRIYLLLWFGAPFLAILTGGLCGVLGASNLVTIVAIAISMGCWPLAIFLLFRWKRSDEVRTSE
jgi:ABC-type antimicrobial peptide transport system permease subunit